MKPIRLRRSALYLPGSNARALEKARGIDADVLIFDLEDAVAPGDKEDAREAVRGAIALGGYDRHEVVVRINAFDTDWGSEDLFAAVAAEADAVLVPKIRTVADVRAVESSLDAMDATGRIAIWAMIETPQAVLDLREIAALGDEEDLGLDVFVLGTNDLARETRVPVEAGRDALVPWIQSVLLAARAHGLDVLDGVFNSIADGSGFAAECYQGRQLGLDGKTCIHPSQVEPANATYAPNQAELDWAARVVAEFEAPENAGQAVLRLDGRMIERLHAEMAARTLALARAVEESDAAHGSALRAIQA